MNNNVLGFLLIRIFCAFLISALFSLKLKRRESGTLQGDSRLYSAIISPWTLPIWLLVSFLGILFFSGFRFAIEDLIWLLFNINISTLLYYLIILLLLPYMRGHVLSRTLSSLWLIPEFLFIMVFPVLRVPEPLVVFFINRYVLQIIFLIWLAGAILVIGKSIVSHLWFRTKLSSSCTKICDENINREWNQCLKKTGMEKAKIQLYTSANIQTPVSVGLFRGSTFVCLPAKYCKETELSKIRLVLMHELIHIRREDSVTKLFLCICTAINWYNPILWIGLKKCSQDLELSCDELVLIHSSIVDKRNYTDAILSISGNDQGFTSCLSTNGKTMLYRLKQITNPRKKKTGAWIAGTIACFLLLSCGFWGITFDHSTLSNNISSIDTNNSGQWKLESVSGYFDGIWQEYNCSVPEKLIDYIFSFPTTSLIGRYYTSSIAKLALFFKGSNAHMELYLTDHVAYVIQKKNGGNYAEAYYYLKTKADWNYVFACLQQSN